MNKGHSDPKLLIIFLTYSGVYSGAEEKFIKLCRNLKTPKKMLIIRNDTETLPLQQINDWIYEMGGDNSVYEFSGWQKGIDSEFTRSFDPDVYLFTASSLVQKKFYAMPILTDEIIHYTIQRKCMAGNKREFPFDVAYNDWDMRQFISTHIFFLPKKIIKDIRTVVSETDPHKFIKKTAAGLVIDHPAWNKKFKKYIISTLTTKYHTKGKSFHPDQFPFFQRKFLTIMNEILLSARIKKLNYPLVDIVPFPKFLNSYYVIFTPSTTISIFQFFRRISLEFIRKISCGRLGERLGWKNAFEQKCRKSVMDHLAGEKNK